MKRSEKTDAELFDEMLECARTGEDKRFRKLYRKLSNKVVIAKQSLENISMVHRMFSDKDIPPARAGCGMSFKEKNREKGTIRL